MSFAPEATLHTWDIVELPEDATTSSEATNSTRRASSGSTLQNGAITANQSVFGTTYRNDIPSTPFGHENGMANLPANPQNQHQQISGRDSNAHSTATEDLEAFSSPGGSIISELMPSSDDEVELYNSEEDSDGDKDSVVESNLTNRINDEDENDDSTNSESPNGTISIGRPIPIDPFLLETGAGNENQDFTIADGKGATMDLVDGDTMLIPSALHVPGNAIRTRSQEQINPFSPAFGTKAADSEREDNSEMSMDMTVMIGGIMKTDESPKKAKRKSIAPIAQRSMARRQSSIDSAVLADETMDLVTVYGGIQGNSRGNNHTIRFEQEEISMDMTQAIGKIALPTTQSLPEDAITVGDLSMDMTQALGVLLPTTQVAHNLAPARHPDTEATSEFDEQETIANNRLLSPVTEHTEPSEHGTINMDMTKAVGYIFEDILNDEKGMDANRVVDSILPTELRVDDKLLAKQLMEEEADHGQLTRSPFLKEKNQSSEGHDTENTGSSKLPNYLTATHATSAKQSTPKKMLATPSKQLTPNPNRPITPSKTPPNPNISMRKTSPKRLFKSSLSKSPKVATPNLQLSKNLFGFVDEPLVVLTPRSRRASGIGIDQIGMGSPVVAAKLDRRASIGDSTPQFIPAGSKGVHFEDPRAIASELDNESADLAFRESRHELFTHSPDAKNQHQDSTSSLKDMIAHLSPKKNKFKGRKSLAPSARGILGKRPVELDEDEDATPKKLKGIQSPVKSIHLPGPMEDTTLRLGSTPHLAFPSTTSISKDQSQTLAFSSEQQPEESHMQRLPNGKDQMSLQDFLNFTNIQFIDLTTTKRRHTATGSNDNDQTEKGSAETTLTDCVVAGVCTIPMLDLFQHSCRELKKYISEGRSVVREIEKDTLEDNPALFHEYICAPPDVREIMDNQFKNIKVHARHESKASWYEWRSKLFDGLKSGLVVIHEGLLQDDKILGEREKLLLEEVTPIIEKHAALRENAEMLQSQVDELANCDQVALQAARRSLSQREQDIKEKKQLLTRLQAEFAQGKQDIIEIEERRIETVAEIKEANRVADENRGWTFGEVKALKGTARLVLNSGRLICLDAVNILENRTGWSLSTCDATNLTFAYQETLFLSVVADLSESPVKLKSQEPVSLSYEPKNDSPVATEPPTIYRFLLQNLKARLSALPHSSPLPDLRSVLSFVSSGWDLAQSILAETARVRAKFHTTEQILDDSTLLAQSMILLRAPEETDAPSKLYAQIIIKIQGESTQVSSKIDFKIKTVYGKEFKEENMIKFVKSRIKGSSSQTSTSGWKEALVDLKAALLKGKIGLS